MQSALAKAISGQEPRLNGQVPGRNGRFNIYRNNYLTSLSRALSTSFPVTELLLGSEFFEAASLAFADHQPPTSPLMFAYGRELPDFLEQFESIAPYPYVPDVARIEYARVAAYHAGDADLFIFDDTKRALSAIADLHGLHPSAHIIASKHPALSIWKAQSGDVAQMHVGWQPEAVLVWRKANTVTAKTLDAHEFKLLSHISAGGTLAEIVEANLEPHVVQQLIHRFIQLAAEGVIVPERGQKQ